jgi:FkbM family methyltransferase
MSPNALAVSFFIKGDAERIFDEKLLGFLINEGDFFIDVGANIGHISISLALKKNVSGMAIEASPKTYKYLKKNLELNNLNEKIISLSCAIGDTDFRSFSIQDSFSDDCNAIVDDRYYFSANRESTFNVSHSSTSQVEGRTLDSLALDFCIPKPIRLIKFDIEGFELFAFRGAKSVLQATELVYFEYWDDLTRKYGYGAEEVEHLITSCGFELFIPAMTFCNDGQVCHSNFTPIQSLGQIKGNANILGVNRLLLRNLPW